MLVHKAKGIIGAKWKLNKQKNCTFAEYNVFQHIIITIQNTFAIIDSKYKYMIVLIPIWRCK